MNSEHIMMGRKKRPTSRRQEKWGTSVRPTQQREAWGRRRRGRKKIEEERNKKQQQLLISVKNWILCPFTTTVQNYYKDDGWERARKKVPRSREGVWGEERRRDEGSVVVCSAKKKTRRTGREEQDEKKKEKAVQHKEQGIKTLQILPPENFLQNPFKLWL